MGDQRIERVTSLDVGQAVGDTIGEREHDGVLTSHGDLVEPGQTVGVVRDRVEAVVRPVVGDPAVHVGTDRAHGLESSACGQAAEPWPLRSARGDGVIEPCRGVVRQSLQRHRPDGLLVHRTLDVDGGPCGVGTRMLRTNRVQIDHADLPGRRNRLVTLSTGVVRRSVAIGPGLRLPGSQREHNSSHCCGAVTARPRSTGGGRAARRDVWPSPAGNGGRKEAIWRRGATLSRSLTASIIQRTIASARVALTIGSAGLVCEAASVDPSLLRELIGRGRALTIA